MTLGGVRAAAAARPVYAAGFVTAFGAHAVAANLAVYAVERHTSLLELGLLLGLYDIAEVVLKPVFGSVVDRRGAKRVMVGGLAAFALASGAFALAGDAGSLGVVRLAQGCAAAAFSPAASAALASTGRAKRSGRLFGTYGAVKGFGYLLGPVVGGALVEVGGHRTLFGSLGVVALVVAVWTARDVPVDVPRRRERSTLKALSGQLRDPTFLQPVLLLAAGTAAMSAAVGFLPLVGARHHLTPLATGALVSLLAGTAAVLQPFVGRRHDRRPFSARVSSAAILMTAVGLAIPAVRPTVAGIVAAALVVGVGVAVVTPVGFACLAATAPEGRLGRTMGTAEVGRELGDAGGPLLVGAFGPAGLAAGLLALAGALVVAAGLTAPAITRPKTRQPLLSPGDEGTP